MSKRPRRNHVPAFKAKEALEALKGDQRTVDLAERYQPDYCMEETVAGSFIRRIQQESHG